MWGRLPFFCAIIVFAHSFEQSTKHEMCADGIICFSCWEIRKPMLRPCIGSVPGSPDMNGGFRVLDESQRDLRVELGLERGRHSGDGDE